jgi:hypothetical protein
MNNLQPKWLDRAKDTYKFHRSHLISTEDWTLTKTAKALRRSLGSICEDILIAKWCRTHENQILKFEYARDALEFIRKKQKELNTAEID